MSKIVSSDEQLKITRQIVNLRVQERTTLNPEITIKDKIAHLKEELVRLKIKEKEGDNNDKHKR